MPFNIFVLKAFGLNKLALAVLFMQNFNPVNRNIYLLVLKYHMCSHSTNTEFF